MFGNLYLEMNYEELMKSISNTDFSSKNLIEPRPESYLKTSKRYLDNLINTIAKYAPFIAFWTAWLYTIREIEGHAIIGRDFTTTTTTPQLDQVDIRPLPLVPTREPCIVRTPFRASDIHICDYARSRTNNRSCTIL